MYVPFFSSNATIFYPTVLWLYHHICILYCTDIPFHPFSSSCSANSAVCVSTVCCCCLVVVLCVFFLGVLRSLRFVCPAHCRLLLENICCFWLLVASINSVLNKIATFCALFSLVVQIFSRGYCTIRTNVLFKFSMVVVVRFWNISIFSWFSKCFFLLVGRF